MVDLPWWRDRDFAEIGGRVLLQGYEREEATIIRMTYRAKLTKSAGIECALDMQGRVLHSQ